MMFPYERVKLLNQLELSIYKYIIAHPVEVEGMTIRQLAKKSHVSPTTILRFLHKMDFDGYSEFKYALKRQQKMQTEQPKQQRNVPMSQFFDQVNDAHFLDKIQQAANYIIEADTSLLFGLGTSGSLAQYGARLLANYGIYTLSITDPFQPKPLARRDFSDTLLLLLSVSGETAQVLQQAKFYQENGAKTMAITANRYSTLAQLVDFNISYNVPEVLMAHLNLTSQIPVVFLLEQIGIKAHKDLLKVAQIPKDSIF